MNIENAKKIQGWMTIREELPWIAEMAARSSTKIVVEIGSWKGRSTRCWADNARPGTKIYAIDTWAGSAIKVKQSHVDLMAKIGGPDGLFELFKKNMGEHLETMVVPVRGPSHEMVNDPRIKKLIGKVDIVFIDGGHRFVEIYQDIADYLPLVKSGGIMSGHDYSTDAIARAVTMHFPNVKPGRANKIWWVGC